MPYKVLEYVRPNLPIYYVQKEGEEIKTRILHRNLLFPLICRNFSEDWNDQQQNVNDENENSHSKSSGNSGVNS